MEDGTQQASLCHIAIVQAVVVAILGIVADDVLASLLHKLVALADTIEVGIPEAQQWMVGCCIGIGSHLRIIMQAPRSGGVISHTVA